MLGVVIEGNENLQFGENTVTITVTAEDGITVKTYTILVHRKTQEEEIIEQEMEEEQNKVEDQAKNKSNKFNWWWIIAIIPALIIGGIIAWIWWKNKNKEV
jgi:ATP-dependent Zn protease